MNAVTQTYDEGLRTYFLRIYNHMFAGLVVTGLVAWLGAATIGPVVMSSLLLALTFALAPLGFLILLLVGLDKFSAGVATLLFYLYSTSMGLSFISITMIYALGSMVQVLFITASIFAAASIYGYTTKADMTKFGAFLFMGLVGIIIASVVNIFLQSSAFAWFVSMAAVIVFTGLTAYDTQQLKEEYYSNGSIYGYSSQEASAIHGALTLYLNFVNLFIHLLQLFGQKKY